MSRQKGVQIPGSIFLECLTTVYQAQGPMILEEDDNLNKTID